MQTSPSEQLSKALAAVDAAASAVHSAIDAVKDSDAETLRLALKALPPPLVLKLAHLSTRDELKAMLDENPTLGHVCRPGAPL